MIQFHHRIRWWFFKINLLLLFFKKYIYNNPNIFRMLFRFRIYGKCSLTYWYSVVFQVYNTRHAVQVRFSGGIGSHLALFWPMLGIRTQRATLIGPIFDYQHRGDFRTGTIIHLPTTQEFRFRLVSPDTQPTPFFFIKNILKRLDII